MNNYKIISKRTTETTELGEITIIKFYKEYYEDNPFGETDQETKVEIRTDGNEVRIYSQRYYDLENPDNCYLLASSLKSAERLVYGILTA